MKADLLISRVLTEGIKIDNWSGLGSNDNDGTDEPHEFIVKMKPRDFLSLNPPIDDPYINPKKIPLERKNITGRVVGRNPETYRDLANKIGGGEAISAPHLFVDWASKGFWQVMGHEGRHRMAIADKLFPEQEVPVRIFSFSRRNFPTTLTDDHLFAPIRPDQARPFGRDVVFKPKKVIHGNEYRTPLRPKS